MTEDLFAASRSGKKVFFFAGRLISLIFTVKPPVVPRDRKGSREREREGERTRRPAARIMYIQQRRMRKGNGEKRMVPCTGREASTRTFPSRNYCARLRREINATRGARATSFYRCWKTEHLNGISRLTACP